jgi:cytochrome c oxidase assembly protein subunit 15
VTAVAVLAIGTVVTGSGPHAGDANARRTGLDPQEVTQLHTDLVFLLIGLSVALWFALRAADARPSARRAVGWLIAVEAAQGGIGFVQYFTHLPALAVGLHMLGACAVWIAVLSVLEQTRTATTTKAAVGAPVAGASVPGPASNPLPPALARPGN